MEKSNNILDLLKRIIQWAHYQGGLSLVFIIFGFILILIFSLFSYWYGNNWVVLVLGIASISLGLFLLKYKSN